MKKFSRTCLVLGAFLSTTCLASPAMAQTYQPPAAPPIRQTIDPNGVDLSGGTMIAGTHSVSIGGKGAQGLSWSRAVTDGYSHWDSTAIILSVSGSKYTVSAGTHSESFTLTGSDYVSDQKFGSTLTLSGTTWTYTTSDGTAYTLVPWSSVDQKQYGGTYRVSSVTYPTGEKLTFNWEVVSGICYWNEKYMFCIDKTGERLRSVQSTNGYQLQFTFDVEDPSQIDGPAIGWAHIHTVTALNSSVDPASQTWPTLTLSWPSSIPLTGVASVNDSVGRTTNYTFSSSVLTGIKHPGFSSNDVSIGHNTSGMVSAVAREGTSANYTYSDLSNVRTTTVSDSVPGDRVVKTDLTTGLVSSDTNEAGKTTAYTYYSGSGLPWTVTAPEGNNAVYEYDSRGNRTKMTLNPKPSVGGTPIVTQASYPTSDPVKTWQCASGPTAVQCNEPVTTTDAKGNVTNYSWDPATGLPTVVTLPAPTIGAVRPQTRNTYSGVYAKYRDGSGNLVNFATPVTRLTASSQCRTLSSCAGTADERLASVAYTNNNALPSSVTAKAGDGTLVETSAITYDTVGNVVAIDGPLAGTADTSVAFYDLTREQTGAISPDPDGAGGNPNLATRTTYDSAGHPYLVEQGTTAGQTASALASMTVTGSQVTGYDSYQRPVTVTSKGSDGVAYALTQTGYNTAGQVSCTATRMNPAVYGSFPATDACTLGTTGSNGPDRITSYHYDAVGRADSVTTGYGTGDAATEEALTFTDNGKAATAKDAQNNCTQYEYDGFDRVIKTHFPSSTVGAACSLTSDYEQYGLDANGTLTSFRTRRGETLTLTYDNLNRLITKVVPERTGLSSTYTRDAYYGYDLFGDPTYARFDSTSGEGISSTYDALGRQLTETQAIDGTSRAITSSYDADNARVFMAYPDGNYINYLRDGLERLYYSELNASSPLFYPPYDTAGRVSALYRWGAAAGTWQPVTGYAYDAISRLSYWGHDLTGTTYDTADSFSYNPASQVISRTNSNDSYAWHGQVNVPGRAYTANGINQFSAVAGTSFSYDTDGNLTSDGANNYVYDVENRLVSATIGSTTATLRYDPLGRLYEVNGSATGITRFLNDGDDLVGEYNSSGTLLRRYVHGDSGGDDPQVWFEGSGVADTARRYLFSDERGSIVAITDSAGNETALNSYDEYGIPDDAGSLTTKGRFRYTGQAWIPELGMFYYKARMYSPTLGRFMQNDPIGYGDGMNMYRYTHNDPVNGIDPSGQVMVLVCVTPGPYDSDGYGHMVQPPQSCSYRDNGVPDGFDQFRFNLLQPGGDGRLLSSIAKISNALAGSAVCLAGAIGKHKEAVGLDALGLGILVFAPEASVATQVASAAVGTAALGVALAQRAPGATTAAYVGREAAWGRAISLSNGVGKSTLGTLTKNLSPVALAASIAMDAVDVGKDYVACQKSSPK